MSDTLTPQEHIVKLKEEKKSLIVMFRLMFLAFIVFALTVGYANYQAQQDQRTIHELAAALHNQREQFLDCRNTEIVPEHVECTIPVSPPAIEIVEGFED